MNELIKVRWKEGDGRGPKGQIVTDTRGRRKIVFIAGEYRGRMPRIDEVTEARVTYEGKPEDPERGFLKVIPIFPADPDALSTDEARAHMLQMAKEAGPIFDKGRYGGRYIEVDLPGWVGTLRGRCLDRPQCETPLSVYWVFQSDDGTKVMVVSEPGVPGVSITKGIFVNDRGITYLVDWAQAVVDLGQPLEVEAEPGHRFTARWVDRYGGKLEVHGIPFDKVIDRTGGIEITDIHPNESGKIIGTASLLDGRIVEHDEYLAMPEYVDYDTYQLQPARFEHRWEMSVQAQRLVAQLLRPGLHSTAWHKQHVLSLHLSEKGDWSMAMWETLRRLQQQVEDKFCPLVTIERALKDVRTARGNITSLVERDILPFDPAIADQRIYAGVVIDDDATTAELQAANQVMIDRVDAKITELEVEIKRLPARRTGRGFRNEVWAAAVEILEKIEGLGDRVRNVLIKEDLNRLIIRADGTAFPIEEVLFDFYQIRRSFENVLERVKREDEEG